MTLKGLRAEALSNLFKKIQEKAEKNFYWIILKKKLRRVLILPIISFTSSVRTFVLGWRHDNKPIELWSNEVIQQKIEYIHNNPVEEGFVFRPEDYKYSSASDYAGEKGLLDGVCVFQYFKM